MAGPRLGAVVLAAGEARRMGGRPKALIERDGVPLVRRVLRAALEAGSHDVVVVLGHRAAEIGAACADLPVRAVVNEQFAAGRVGSLRCGLAALPASVEVSLVMLADQPLLEADDLHPLLAAFARRGSARCLVPRVHGERGHPVVIEAAVGREILASDAGIGARQWMDAHPDDVAWFDSDRPCFCTDLDEPGDLERVSRRHGCTLRWPDTT